MDTFTHTIQTPIGPITINSTSEIITAVHFNNEGEILRENSETIPEVLQRCMNELTAYFAGTLTTFSVPYEQPGTPFQQSVWQQLCIIPYGETITYLQQAKRLNNPKSIRAVGVTNGKNNLPIIVPCHRVIGANGALTGFAGGIWRKKWLLEHESNQRFGQTTLF